MDKRDPKYTGYYPKTCSDAIMLFYKKRDLGEIIWDDIDVVFRQCARDLPSSECTKFVRWIVNPSELHGTEPCPLPRDGMAHTMEEKVPESSDPKTESCSKDSDTRCDSVCSVALQATPESPSQQSQNSPEPPQGVVH